MFEVHNAAKPVTRDSSDPGDTPNGQPLTVQLHLAGHPFAGMPVESLAGLTPEALVSFVGTQLRQIDEQILGYTKEANRSREASKALQDAKAYLANCNSGDEGMTVKNPKVEAEFLARAAALDAAGEPEAAALMRTYAKAAATGEHKAHECMSADADVLQGRLDNLNRGAELEMIKMQSLVQQRTQVIMFSSNVLAAYNQALMTPIQNTGK